MRAQLIKYVELLFAGTPDSYDMQQEILQNTLDRYDDLISQGKSPEAAYRLAISGIGDINEILGSIPAQESPAPAPKFDPSRRVKPQYRHTPLWKTILRAAAVFLYIIGFIPLFILGEMDMGVIGLCGMFAIWGVATVLFIIASAGGEKKEDKEENQAPLSPQQELRNAVKKVINTVGLVLYFVISFWSGAWHITWLIFPIMAAVQGVVNACIDLQEANKHEA